MTERPAYHVDRSEQPGLWVVRDAYGRRVGVPYLSEDNARRSARAMLRSTPRHRGQPRTIRFPKGEE